MRSLLPVSVLLLVAAACQGTGTSEGDILLGCEPKSRRCDQDRVVECLAEGNGWKLIADCTAFAAVCVDGVCTGGNLDVTPLPDDSVHPDATKPHPDTTPLPEDAGELPVDAGELPVDATLLPDTSTPDGNPLADVQDAQDALPPDSAPPGDAADLPDLASWDTTSPDDGGGSDLVEPDDSLFPQDTPPPEDSVELSDVAEPKDTSPLEDTPSPPDAPNVDTGAPDPSSYGFLQYAKVANLQFKDDFVDVAWRPDGSEALLITQAGTLVRYDPVTHELTQAADLKGTPSQVAWHPAGTFAYVAGRNADAPRLWRYEPGAGATVEPFLSTAGVRLASVSFHSDGRVLVSGYSESPIISRLYVIAPPWDKVTAQQAWGGWPGISDAAFAAKDPLVYDGAEFVLTSEGYNGANSHVWLTVQNSLLDSGWKAGFGNPGGIAWRPWGSLAVLVGTSSNVLYLFDQGTWDKVYTVDTGSNLSATAWNPDGTRLLILGRAFGNPLKGTVVEYRLFPGVGATSGIFVDQSIPGFGAAPYNANSNTYLRALAFRPGTDCEEGLVVGSDNGTSWSPTFGLVLRFEDAVDPACPGLIQ